MSVLIDSARSAVLRDGQIIITLESGSEIRFPVAENPRLAPGTPEQLNQMEISPYGIHWPELDEDLSFQGALRERLVWAVSNPPTQAEVQALADKPDEQINTLSA